MQAQSKAPNSRSACHEAKPHGPSKAAVSDSKRFRPEGRSKQAAKIAASLLSEIDELMPESEQEVEDFVRDYKQKGGE